MRLSDGERCTTASWQLVPPHLDSHFDLILVIFLFFVLSLLLVFWSSIHPLHHLLFTFFHSFLFSSFIFFTSGSP